MSNFWRQKTPHFRGVNHRTIVGNRSGVDIYSHRYPPDTDIGPIQAQIVCEDLIRKSFGYVHEKQWLVSMRDSPQPSISKGEIEKIIRSFNPTLVIGSYDQHYFVCDKWIISLGYLTSYDSAVGGDVVYEIRVDLKCVDYGFFEIVEKALRDAGFNIIEGKFKVVGDNVPVTFAFPEDGGVDYKTKSFGPILFKAVEQNYSLVVVAAVKDLIKKIEDTTNGLILISGPVGTGKSYLIRSLLTELKAKRRALVCSPPSYFLEYAGRLATVASEFNKSIVVLEDVGSILEIDSPSKAVDQRANLLNFSDGLLSLLADTLIVVSFNHDVEKLDPAVTRPGRCVANIVIGNLPYEHAQSLVQKVLPENRSYSLAEVYEFLNTGKIDPKRGEQQKVGFSSRKPTKDAR